MTSDAQFEPTRWTLVLRAAGSGGDAKSALSDLCGAYYAPVVTFLRREGRDEDAAREMAHAFFEGLLEGGVGTPERERGRFRSYLLGALKHFLVKHRAAAAALKPARSMCRSPANTTPSPASRGRPRRTTRSPLTAIGRTPSSPGRSPRWKRNTPRSPPTSQP